MQQADVGLEPLVGKTVGVASSRERVAVGVVRLGNDLAGLIGHMADGAETVAQQVAHRSADVLGHNEVG